MKNLSEGNTNPFKRARLSDIIEKSRHDLVLMYDLLGFFSVNIPYAKDTVIKSLSYQ